LAAVIVGVWCAYGKTLTLTDGIGVFAHNLAKYLAQSPRVNGVVLAVHAGDEADVAATIAAGGGKIWSVALQTLPLLQRWRRRQLRWRHRALSRRLATLGDAGGLGGSRQQALLAGQLQETEVLTARLLAQQPASDPKLLAGPAAGGCDVWVLPHISVERAFQSATVVMIHDMVPLRERGLVKPHDLASFRRRSQAVAERSTLIGCMSEVIRDSDIVGLLGCPAEKVRVVPPAVPDDIGFAEAAEAVETRASPAALPEGVTPPYLLYPAAFRSYKNHELLIDALSHLDARELPRLQLVFTGDGPLPKFLQERAAACGMSDRVLTLGRVDRETLEHLYRSAAATMVPSRHEQGSFPVLEALACGCPVAVSDIPSLREAFGAMADTMPFFDPASPAALADAVALLLRDPHAVRAKQAAGFRALRGRTWGDAAEEWIDVFAEAIHVHQQA
jgi:glycosyltransferase involved in cell wall biosynthesis